MATNRKIARSKRTNKPKAANPEILRAAARAKLSVTPWPGEPDPGAAMLEALRQAEWPGDHVEVLRKHARSYEQAVVDLTLEKKEAEKAEGKPVDPWLLTGAAFDGGEDLHDDTTPADLFKLCFEAPNRPGLDDDLLRDVLLSVADEVELLGEAMQADFLNKDAVARWALRTTYRVRVAVAFAKRMNAAEGGAS